MCLRVSVWRSAVKRSSGSELENGGEGRCSLVVPRSSVDLDRGFQPGDQRKGDQVSERQQPESGLVSWPVGNGDALAFVIDIIQNVRRGHDELGTERSRHLRIVDAFEELIETI